MILTRCNPGRIFDVRVSDEMPDSLRINIIYLTTLTTRDWAIFREKREIDEEYIYLEF